MGFAITIRGDRIEVVMEGMVTIAEATVHLDQLSGRLSEMRARSGKARVLIDASGSVPQTGEVARYLGERTGRLYAPGDRVALFTASALLSSQARRVTSIENYGVFSTISEARAFIAQ